MKIILKELVLAIFLTVVLSPQLGFSENHLPSTSPAQQTLGSIVEEVRKEHDRATKEVETAEREINKLQATSPAESAEKISDQTKQLDIAQNKVKVAQQRLEALTSASAALRDQDPIRKVIGELKSRLDEFPADGSESQKEYRATILTKINELEKIGSPEGAGSLGWIGVIAIVVVVIALIMIFLRLWQDAGNSGKNASDDDSVARVRLAKAVTLGAMVFIVFVSVLTLLFAGINAAIAPHGVQDTVLFFDIAKWVLATVLPVVAAWVGGVMAYYFGKENFKAGAENAEKLVKELKLTPQQKLETQKAGESGKEIDKAAVYKLAPGTNLDDIDLKVLEQAFVKNNKTYERLPILDYKDCIQACLHMATFTKYTNGLSDQDKNNASKMKLGELAKSLSWKPDLSFDTVSPKDNLLRVQELIKARKECSDVFVTANGTKANSVQRWITNDDIMRITDA